VAHEGVLLPHAFECVSFSRSNDASTVRQLEGDSPRHKVVVQSLLNLPGDFVIDLTYRYVSAVNKPEDTGGITRATRD
jgi:hypothetical protein